MANKQMRLVRLVIIDQTFLEKFRLKVLELDPVNKIETIIKN